MKYKVQDDGKDHTPIYKQGVNKELWSKNVTRKVTGNSYLIDFSKGGSSELKRKFNEV